MVREQCKDKVQKGPWELPEGWEWVKLEVCM